MGAGGRATNDFEKMGRKQFPGVFMEHLPIQNVSVLFFSFFFLKEKTGNGRLMG